MPNKDQSKTVQARQLAAIAFGSNLADRGATLRDAASAVAAIPGVRLLALSRWFETAPVGPIEQGKFLNAAAIVETTLPPHDLLSALLAIELRFGRDRSAQATRWGPRTLDLDLLVYGSLVLQDPALELPHPRMHEREFVLAPLASIAPHLAITTLQGTIETPERMLAALTHT
jgi:2-amino-4-hydroxy-6-hydroxymethyldihydropteridine diphosphokinase